MPGAGSGPLVGAFGPIKLFTAAVGGVALLVNVIPAPVLVYDVAISGQTTLRALYDAPEGQLLILNVYNTGPAIVLGSPVLLWDTSSPEKALSVQRVTPNAMDPAPQGWGFLFVGLGVSAGYTEVTRSIPATLASSFPP